MTFPEGFIWGAAASSYQLEGGVHEDGKGESVWDRFCRRPGAIDHDQSGEISTDHYHRFAEDVGLMKEIGLDAYRFSISWPRILPEGSGRINPAGLAFYDRLVDSLLEAGIRPFPTLYHWDHPVALHHRGGWLNASSPDWFAEYAGVLADKLSDRAADWITINEPQSFIGLGHQQDLHPPGSKVDVPDFLRISHHVLLAHGRSVQALRARAKQKLNIGYAPVAWTYFPASDKPEDIEAARRKTFTVENDTCESSSWWMDPIVLGRYPQDGLDLYGDDMPAFTDADMKTIAEPLDFLGLNFYFGMPTRAGRDGRPEVLAPLPGRALTAMEWPVTEDVLYWGPKFFGERYNIPLIITENGMANTDWLQHDRRVHDTQRIDFLGRYLLSLRRCIAEGTDVRGYFVWSVIDNFEWVKGYQKRFGLIYVDYQTLERTLKDSAYWYRDIIASNGATLDQNWFIR